MRQVLLTLAALAILGALGAAVIVGFGLYNVSARQGHLTGVSTVLHTTFQQSVRLRAPSPEAIPDDIDHPDRIALGAQHFQAACAFCHAVPGQGRSATALSMTPAPPHISQAVAPWAPQHLFWIVREGVKMSGMPHWPAEGRDDEIWSVVAYLKAIQGAKVQDQAGRRDARPGGPSCRQCHGPNGRSGNRFVPRLDILTVAQIGEALTQYRDGRRASGLMQEAATGLSDDQIATLAENFGAAGFPEMSLPAEGGADPAGRQLATRGSAKVPACTACHGPGRSADAPIAPAIAGQSQAYLEHQLRLWRDGTRGGGMRAGLMRQAAQRLTEDEITALAAWYAGLDAARRSAQ